MIIHSILTGYKKGFTFKGRASRSEFWPFAILEWLICYVIGAVADAVFTSGNNAAGVLCVVLYVLCYIPLFTAAVRRFHDRNKSGWLLTGILLASLAVVGLSFLALLYLETAVWICVILEVGAFIYVLSELSKKGTPGSNRFGEDPLMPIQH